MGNTAKILSTEIPPHRLFGVFGQSVARNGDSSYIMSATVIASITFVTLYFATNEMCGLGHCAVVIPALSTCFAPSLFKTVVSSVII